MQNKNIFYVVLGLEILVVLFVALGLIPREAALIMSGIMVFYFIFSKLEDGLILFIVSIPIFVALPITESFDSLSAGRLFVLILFLKWLFSQKQIKFIKLKRLEILSILLLLVLILSIFPAIDKIAAIKKIIYLVNLAVIFLIVRDTIKDKIIFKRAVKAVLISSAIVFLIGFGQLISAYFFTIGSFWDWWSDHVSLGFYGENLRQIVKTNNAWFVNSPSGPSVIRLFGSFTDPHSFALYLLLTLPFIISLAITQIKEKFHKEWIWLILSLFFIILSGTRGIWFGITFGFLAAIYLLIKKININRCVSCILATLVIFVFLIPITSIFTTIPQFRERAGQSDAALILKRLASILNLDELSNQGRIYIWKRSLESFKEHPILGIGAGNFPVVLEQEIVMAKAGSSAHNLYLNFLVENGLFAFILIVFMVWEILSVVFSVLKLNLPQKTRILITGLFIYLVWAFGYSLFDIALLDERVFLIFLTILGIIYAIKNKPEIVLENE
ncbi:O-antigen ligase family protein [Patescibacteria group bacterium]|nr:O-antigen ligase family protein [Patescibacteria group bacterium]MBU4458757.1 O-antigen ligase family protein [Patescibacteria group bacterium]MCG2696058.1 O-antigen ligase family protein [Candidatus Portnoybacteria bacterium]